MKKKCPNCGYEKELIFWGSGRLLHCQLCGVLQFYKMDGKKEGRPIYNNFNRKIPRLK